MSLRQVHVSGEATRQMGSGRAIRQPWIALERGVESLCKVHLITISGEYVLLDPLMASRYWSLLIEAVKGVVSEKGVSVCSGGVLTASITSARVLSAQSG